MPYLLVLFLILHVLIIRLFGKALERKTQLRGFALLLVLSPFSISLSLLFARISGLSFRELGISLGDFIPGMLFFILSVPMGLLSFFSILRAPAVWIMRIRYGNVDKSRPQLVYSWLVVGVVEELLYRGFFQGGLSKYIKTNFFTVELATVIASIVFVFIHIGNVLVKAESFRNFRKDFVPRLFASFILGYSFQISRSLLYPVLIHNLLDGLTMTGLIYRKKRILNERHEILFSKEPVPKKDEGQEK
ncbi:hypothetical protein AT15_05450 [Kosmotoga arenicorallina S304]|uniref:CAAX prenyl protease 2/Lysostaphin resistance protein A-like domain-containing protein n=1 Tax=Kosmotoga arenicorallina S304 TaxID=1453497 RepID=A0A182C7E2_9BACT|nr:type II CAAX endopeptidase family protein [Kosmotoga arenicorallina]OAA31519.1 hypothetical protein AT15_05450 [Kosmotoga arenicorallina S304]